MPNRFTFEFLQELNEIGGRLMEKGTIDPDAMKYFHDIIGTKPRDARMAVLILENGRGFQAGLGHLDHQVAILPPIFDDIEKASLFAVLHHKYHSAFQLMSTPAEGYA